MACMCRAQCGGSAMMNPARKLVLPRQTALTMPIIAKRSMRQPARATPLRALSQPDNIDGLVQGDGVSQVPAQQHFIRRKLAALEVQRLARYNTVREAQTVAHLEKLDRIIVKATKRSQERKANQYTLQAKAKLLEQQQRNIESTLQDMDSEQSNARRRADFCLAQASHNKTQTSRAKVKASAAKRQADRIQQQLWSAQQELGSLDKLKSSHEEEERSPAEQALFEAILRLGMVLEKPLRPAFSAVQGNDDKLAWVQDPEVLYL